MLPTQEQRDKAIARAKVIAARMNSLPPLTKEQEQERDEAADLIAKEMCENIAAQK